MKALTFQEMEDILLAHEWAELEADIEATMATVARIPITNSRSGRWPGGGL